MHGHTMRYGRGPMLPSHSCQRAHATSPHLLTRTRTRTRPRLRNHPQVQPRNYLLLACHASNETVQLYQLSRWYSWSNSAKAADAKRVEPEQAAVPTK